MGNFNINLLQNEKFIVKENQTYELKNSISALVDNYKDFCQAFLWRLLKPLLEIFLWKKLAEQNLAEHAWSNPDSIFKKA